MFRWANAVLLLVISSSVCGCSTSSILIRPDDTAFNRSQQRLDRTAKRVSQSEASGDEKALFLQGEAFYRYRFEPPARGGWSFFAEAAAAVTDFPAFQTLAGSLDLLDLRLRATDAAIQLWETLLTRYPRTPLKPLTLYRLGWAYRSTGLSDFPRKEPNDAFDELVKEAPKSELARLALQARDVPYKSKGTAGDWSLIPGGGQFYVGETGNGVARLSVALAAAAAVIYPLVTAFKRGSDLTWGHDWPLLVLGVGGLSVLSFDYTSSYEDAMRGVVQWNERQEQEFNSAHPGAP